MHVNLSKTIRKLSNAVIDNKGRCLTQYSFKCHPWCCQWLTLCIGTLFLFYDANAFANLEYSSGIGLTQSRVVVTETDKGGTLATVNNNTKTTYLVQSRVLSADGTTGYPLYMDDNVLQPFIVTPPLARLASGARQDLRILKRPTDALPSDRESLFFLLMKAIPSASEDNNASQRPQIAIEQYVKLFYRPSELNKMAIFDGEVTGKLHFSVSNHQLLVNNQSSFYITFGVLKVNNTPIVGDALRRMVPPHGTQSYPLSADKAGGKVTWQIIDEFGLVTDENTQTL